LKILVFIKQVADTEARILISSDKKSLEIENKYNMNFFDEFAVEEAIQIKEKIEETIINVCSYGPKRAIEALRTAIAMGADQAFLLESDDSNNDDPLITAKSLAAFAKKEGFDLILCGRQAIDDESASIGIMTAEFLNIPHVSSILKLDIAEDGKALVESEIEDGRETIEVQLPALFTVQKGINEPRVPLITGVMKAMKAEIPFIDVSSLMLPNEGIDDGTGGINVQCYESPQSRPSVKIIEGSTPEEKVKNLIMILKEEAKAL